MSLLVRARTRLLNILGSPIRHFRQRTIVQLMVSHVAVVLLTLLLLNVVVVAIIVGWLPGRTLIGLEDTAQDFFLGERTRSLALWIDTEDIIADFGPLDSPDAQAELDRLLTMIVNDEVPGYESAESNGDGLVEFGRPQAALITDTEGTILATTDPAIGPVGDSASDITEVALRDALTESIDQHDGSDSSGSVSYSLRVNGDITGAAAPIYNEEDQIDAYLAFQGYPLPEIFSDARSALLRDTAMAVLKMSWIYVMPAILVALPFAYWQSRSTSRRLERLATLADAFAAGDLHTRIRVARHDEIGRLAERFNEMGTRIDEATRSRRAFLSNVSHELRTPVAIIQGTTERLQDHKVESEEEAREAINLVNLEILNLTRLIDDLSTLGRLEEAHLRLNLQPLEVHEIANEAVNGLRDLAWSQRKVSVENLVPPDLPAAFADPGRLRQIVHNLLFNALRHTPEGGLIVVQASTGGDIMEVSVSDTGIGIPPDKLAQVFDRYYQVERSQRTREGSGLGLHIVQQLVEAQGGTIDVESTVGKGTTFRFTLPLASGNRARLAQPDPEEGIV